MSDGNMRTTTVMLRPSEMDGLRDLQEQLFDPEYEWRPRVGQMIRAAIDHYLSLPIKEQRRIVERERDR
jgi:hypothetical protein